MSGVRNYFLLVAATVSNLLETLEGNQLMNFCKILVVSVSHLDAYSNKLSRKWEIWTLCVISFGSLQLKLCTTVFCAVSLIKSLRIVLVIFLLFV